MIDDSRATGPAWAQPDQPDLLIASPDEPAWNALSLGLSVPHFRADAAGFELALDTHLQVTCVVLPVSLAEPQRLREIEWRIAAGRQLRVVIVVEPDEVELVGASLGYSWIDYICGSILSCGVAAAISLAVAKRQFSDSDGVRSLVELGEEAARIAQALSKLAAQLPQATLRVPANELDAVWIRRTLWLRRLRERYFPAELFADPAWDILLDLTAAELEGVAVSVSSLCVAASVPTTTALRWIKGMTEAGLLVREPDPNDARRVFIRLSADGFRRMRDCLLALQGEGYPV